MIEQPVMEAWVQKFIEVLELEGFPRFELFDEGKFCDWRISYGLEGGNDKTYFISFYPAFSAIERATYHYTDISLLAEDVLTLNNFHKECPSERSIEVSDIVAMTFALIRNKESIELFSDQKDLMELGLKHFHLDNYYQDVIKGMVAEYVKDKTVFGKPFSLNLFKVLENGIKKN